MSTGGQGRVLGLGFGGLGFRGAKFGAQRLLRDFEDSLKFWPSRCLCFGMEAGGYMSYSPNS